MGEQGAWLGAADGGRKLEEEEEEANSRLSGPSVRELSVEPHQHRPLPLGCVSDGFCL